MDPGTALSVVSLGIQVCQELLAYYDGWRSYHSDISSTYQSIADLGQTFVVLKASLEKPITSSNGHGIVVGKARVESCIKSCSEGLLRLQKKLSKLRTYSEPQGIRQKAWAEMQRAWWPLRSSTVTKLKKQVTELRENLSLALQTLQQITLDQGLDRIAYMISEVLSRQQTTQATLSNILSTQEAAKLKSIFDWLSAPDHDYEHRTARKACAPGTGAWILGSEKYHINARDFKGYHIKSDTPLQAAARTGNKVAIKLLLNNGADVNATAGAFGNALECALRCGQGEIVELLLDNGADINSEALHEAVFRGEIDIVKLLIDYGADVNAHGQGQKETALEAAVLVGDKEIVTLLLDSGADVNGIPDIQALADRFGTAFMGMDGSIAEKEEMWTLLESYTSASDRMIE